MRPLDSDREPSAPISGPTVRVHGWQWGPDESRRPGLPWIGVFLVVFGALLIVQNALPEYRNLGNTGVLAAGIAFLAAALGAALKLSLCAPPLWQVVQLRTSCSHSTAE